MKLLCKKSFYEHYSKKNEVIFTKGKYYHVKDVIEDEDDNTIIYQIIHEENGIYTFVAGDNDWSSNFGTYFYTMQELRRMKIDNLLKD